MIDDHGLERSYGNTPAERPLSGTVDDCPSPCSCHDVNEDIVTDGKTSKESDDRLDTTNKTLPEKPRL